MADRNEYEYGCECRPEHRLDLFRILVLATLGVCYGLIILGFIHLDLIYLYTGISLYILELFLVLQFSQDLFGLSSCFAGITSILIILTNLAISATMIGLGVSSWHLIPIILGSIILGLFVLAWTLYLGFQLVMFNYEYQEGTKFCWMAIGFVITVIGPIIMICMWNLSLIVGIIGASILGLYIVTGIIFGLMLYFFRSPDPDNPETYIWRWEWTPAKNQNLVYLAAVILSLTFTALLVYSFVDYQPKYYWPGLGLYILNVIGGLILVAYIKPSGGIHDRAFTRCCYVMWYLNVMLLPVGMMCSTHRLFLYIGGGIYGSIFACMLSYGLYVAITRHGKCLFKIIGIGIGICLVGASTWLIIYGATDGPDYFWVIGASLLSGFALIVIGGGLLWYFRSVCVRSVVLPEEELLVVDD